MIWRPEMKQGTPSLSWSVECPFKCSGQCRKLRYRRRRDSVGFTVDFTMRWWKSVHKSSPTASALLKLSVIEKMQRQPSLHSCFHSTNEGQKYRCVMVDDTFKYIDITGHEVVHVLVRRVANASGSPWPVQSIKIDSRKNVVFTSKRTWTIQQ